MNISTDVLADKEVSWGKYKSKLDGGDVAAAIAQLRSQLLAGRTTEAGTRQ